MNIADYNYNTVVAVPGLFSIDSFDTSLHYIYWNSTTGHHCNTHCPAWLMILCNCSVVSSNLPKNASFLQHILSPGVSLPLIEVFYSSG